MLFRSCAVPGADWNPESGLAKWTVFWEKVTCFFGIILWTCRSARTLFHRECAGAVAGSPRFSPSGRHCSALAAEKHRLRFGCLRLRSSRHADCSLLHLSVAESLRSELKPGYSLGSAEFLDPGRSWSASVDEKQRLLSGKPAEPRQSGWCVQVELKSFPSCTSSYSHVLKHSRKKSLYEKQPAEFRASWTCCQRTLC